MRLAKRTLVLASACLTLASSLPGYYHFIRFTGQSAPWTAMPEKFDLEALPNRTLTYFISDQNLPQLGENDSVAGLVSQIRAAAMTWSGVEHSELRLGFGGFTAQGTSQSGPAVEVLFEDVPPGLIAMGGPTVRAEANGKFVPILRSVVIIRPDLSQRASYSESFFGTLVHEFGHALGLQHTLTSGVMSTAVTRSTSKGKPLTADDVAAISSLYPSPSFASSTGTITGRVTMNGAGVNLASVVAIAPNGAAVSTLTQPDGNYRIDGLPSRSYLIYAHPLPPARQGQTTNADIIYPVDSDGRTLPPSPPFDTIFYPGTTEPQNAWTVNVTPGSTSDGINFNVRARAAVGIHSVETYAFPGNLAVKPPYLSQGMSRPFLVITGSGLVQNNAPIPGLKVQVLGGPVLNVKAYPTAPASYIQVDFDVRTLLFASDSPRHLIFSAGSDLYVLPSGMFHVENQPPSISSVQDGFENGERVVLISGNNLSSSTRVLFDGFEGNVRGLTGGGQLAVVPPTGQMGHKANVVVLNADGQSSLFLQSSPPTYTYPSAFANSGAPSLALSTGTLTAGTQLLLRVGTNNVPIDPKTLSLGFGSSDVAVTKLWTASSGHVYANLLVRSEAQPGSLPLTLASGLNYLQQGSAVQVQARSSTTFYLKPDVLNVLTRRKSVSAGSLVEMQVGASPISVTASAVVRVNDRTTPLVSVNGSLIVFRLPQGLETGVATVSLEQGTELSLPIGVQVDAAPPKLTAVLGGDSQVETGLAKWGESLTLVVEDPAAGASKAQASDIHIYVGDVLGKPKTVVEQDGKYRISFVVPSDLPPGPVPVSAVFQARYSEPIHLTFSR